MKKNENAVDNTTNVKKKSNKKLIILLIVVVAIIMILSVILPFAFIFGVALLFSGDTEYKSIDENTIKIPEYNITVEVTDTKYDKEDECFILYTKIDREDKVKNSKIKEFFDYGTSLEVMYKFKDADGYVVGTEYLNIDEIDKVDKWKESVFYCGSYADEITSFEFDSVNVY
ncbi:MAG: hypothetical protein J1F35_03910 [Erysipelotrichales bacterium]|nr:hypothetical protein [Erysipelotrichales bacterium]